jgi:hypothetical protein
MKHVYLVCHPSTPHSPVRAVSVRLGFTAEGGIALAFSLAGDVQRVRVPALRTPRRVDGLWRHTCAEAFVMAGDGPAYREFNFAPSGEWAAYAFRSYRERATEAITLAPGILVQATDERLDLEAVIAVDALPRTSPAKPLRLGLAVVVEDAGGALSYWALQHPSDVPDFHHADAFALDIDPRPY